MKRWTWWPIYQPICVVHLGHFGNWIGLGLICLNCISGNQLQIAINVLKLSVGCHLCIREIIMILWLFCVNSRFNVSPWGLFPIRYYTLTSLFLCHTMACFECALYTLISGGDRLVLALFFHISIYIFLISTRVDFPIICIIYFKWTWQILQINCKIFLDVGLLNKNVFFT